MNLSQTSLRNSEGKRMCCLQRVYLLKKCHFTQGEILALPKNQEQNPYGYNQVGTLHFIILKLCLKWRWVFSHCPTPQVVISGVFVS